MGLWTCCHYLPLPGEAWYWAFLIGCNRPSPFSRRSDNCGQLLCRQSRPPRLARLARRGDGATSLLSHEYKQALTCRPCPVGTCCLVIGSDLSDQTSPALRLRQRLRQRLRWVYECARIHGQSMGRPHRWRAPVNRRVGRPPNSGALVLPNNHLRRRAAQKIDVSQQQRPIWK